MIFNDYTSILIYLAVFALSILGIYLGEKKKIRSFTILGLLVIVIFAAIRFKTGTDTENYRAFYEQVSTGGIERGMARFKSGEMEPFIIVTAIVGGFLNLGEWFMFGLFAFITIYYIYKTVKNFDDKNYWVLYGAVLFMVFPNSLNTMRQMAAMSVLMYLLSLIVNSMIRKNEKVGKLRTLLLILLAISLHYASFALLPILLVPYVTRKFGYHKTFYILGILVIFIITLYKPALLILTNSNILPAKHYSTFVDTEGSLLNFNFLICGLMAIIGGFHYRRHKNKNHLNENNLPIIMMGVAYSAIGFYSGYLGRLADFFWPYAVLMMWNILLETDEPQHRKIIFLYGTAIAYFFLAFVIMGNNKLLPYGIIF